MAGLPRGGLCRNDAARVRPHPFPKQVWVTRRERGGGSVGSALWCLYHAGSVRCTGGERREAISKREVELGVYRAVAHERRQDTTIYGWKP
jgi:hypothetical protein